MLGLEVSGTIVALGPGVDAGRLAVGDKVLRLHADESKLVNCSSMQVCALVNGGGYAEYCTAPQVWSHASGR